MKNFVRPIVLSVLLTFALTVSLQVEAQQENKKKKKSPQAAAAAPAQQAQAQQPPVQQAAAQQAPGQQAQANSITQFAAKSGVNKCLGKINQVTEFVSRTGQSGATVFVSTKAADQQLASVSLEVEKPESVSYVAATFSPGPGNECGATYDEVTYWNNACPEVAGKVYNAFKRGTPLKKTIAVRENGATVRVFFMPAGTGCVVIKKEMVF